jgi:translocation and assembly module TamB
VPGNRLNVVALAKANRVGTLDANVTVPVALRDGVFGVVDDGPLAGRIDADIPSLRATAQPVRAELPARRRAALKLTIAGTPVKPSVSGC